MTTENRTSHPVGAASIAVVTVILLALLVFPGFLAAGFSRASSVPFSIRVYLYWDQMDDADNSAGLKAELCILAPSGWLMRHSRSIRRFYSWQYRLAGGINDPGEQ